MQSFILTTLLCVVINMIVGGKDFARKKDGAQVRDG